MKAISLLHSALINNLLRGALIFGDNKNDGDDDPDSPPTR